MNAEFVGELRQECERRERELESLKKSARNLVTVSAITATLMASVYGTLVEPKPQPFAFNLLFGGVAMMALTAVLCMFVNAVEFQRTVLSGANMTKGSETDFDKVKSWTEAKKDDYHEKIIDKHIKCLGIVEAKIGFKSRFLNAAILTFLSGLLALLATSIKLLPDFGVV